MTIKNFITKGILPLLLIGVITWLGRYIFMVDGSIDWFRFMLVYGVPIGIPYMFIIIPARWDLSGTIGMVALCAAIGAVFGFIVTIGIGIRAVWYSVFLDLYVSLVHQLIKHLMHYPYIPFFHCYP